METGREGGREGGRERVCENRREVRQRKISHSFMHSEHGKNFRAKTTRERGAEQIKMNSSFEHRRTSEHDANGLPSHLRGFCIKFIQNPRKCESNTNSNT